MNDQAEKLRNLMLRHLQDHSPHRPRIVLVAGAKGGVGTTTVALCVGRAMTTLGHRVVLVDGHLRCGDVGKYCGVDLEQPSLADVLGGRREIEDALAPGPEGMLVLTSRWASDQPCDCSAETIRRFAVDLSCLGGLTDWVLVDVPGDDDWLDILQPLADAIVVTTTPDSVALLDAYALLKYAVQCGLRETAAVIVNQASDEAQAAETADRLTRSCKRFLNLTLNDLGWIPYDLSLTMPSTTAPQLPSQQTPLMIAATRVARRLSQTQQQQRNCDAAQTTTG